MKNLTLLMKVGLVLLSLFAKPILVDAQKCTVHGFDNMVINLPGIPGASEFTGQTFMACQTGYITSIQLNLFGLGTYNLRLAKPTGGKLSNIYQTFTAKQQPEPTIINLNIPFPVIAGVIYELQFDHQSQPYPVFGVVGGGDYPDGQATLDGVPYPGPTNSDLDFGVTIQPTLPIPTLGQWGLINLGLILGIFGAAAIKNQLQVNFRRNL